MRRILPLVFSALTFPGIALAASCPKPDPAAVVKAMTDMFAALTVDDGAQLAAIFTPDAVEFDGGKRFTGSGLWDLIKSVHAKGNPLSLDRTGPGRAFRLRHGLDRLHQPRLGVRRSGDKAGHVAGVRGPCERKNRMADPVFALDAGAGA